MTTVTPSTHIIVKGARHHNLKNINLTLPKGKLIVFTGLSGSGKSSLAFDTIYAEGQRRYVESLSSYARQFLGLMQKPDVDQIDGLSPAISIDQKTTSHNPRSTVGTITEIYDYLRLLFARIGHPHCPQCGTEIAPQTIDQITDQVMSLMETNLTSTAPARWLILSPVVRDKKGEFTGLFKNLLKKGYQRVRVDGRLYRLDEDLFLIKTNKHSISVVIDRVSLDKKTLKTDPATFKGRLHQSIEQSLALSDGLCIVSHITDSSLTFPDEPQHMADQLFSQYLACPQCNISIPEIEPRLFSFNTPHGACPRCTGLGNLLKIDPAKIIAPDLTLSEGAIIPLANALSSDSWYARKLKAVLEAHQCDYAHTIYRDLPEPVKKLILYGDTIKEYWVSGENRQGRKAGFSFKYEGIVNEMERRYQETQSEYIRQEFERFMTKEPCPVCLGSRLKKEALSVTITNRNIHQVVSLPINKTGSWLNQLSSAINDPQDSLLSPFEKTVAAGIVKELSNRVNFLAAVGLNYLTLSREASTLAGGEAQRIRLASQIGTGLTGVLYVLDEPTIGLHPKDNDRLIHTLKNLRDLGNTLIVVEHDKAVMAAADYLVDFGPKAGVAGGQIVAEGSFAEVAAKDTLTARYISGRKTIDPKDIDRLSYQLFSPATGLKLPKSSPQSNKSGQLIIKGATAHNLKNLTTSFELGKLNVITGISGSGKSTLMHDTLYPALRRKLHQKVEDLPRYQALHGAENIDKVYLIDQSPIGRTSRSNPATYTKAFDLIRQIYANSKDAKSRGFSPGRFSFNVKGGRCEACQGEGQVKISMQFLADIYVSCEVCKGRRYNNETLNVFYHDKNIAEVLDLTVDEALEFFKLHPLLTRKLATLKAVGLGYIKLGQPAPTLSGGEAQRVKLGKELSIQSPGHTVYLLDEPTTGLHFDDVKKLLVVLRGLVNQNNTVIIIEHNLDVIRCADWVVDLGPEGGQEGGHVVAAGPPTTIAAHPTSYTAAYLAAEFK